MLQLKNLLRNCELAYRSYHGLRLLGQRKYRAPFMAHEHELLRSKGDLEQLSKMALEPVMWEREIFLSNEVYSHDLAFKSFLGLDPGRPLSALIEHGCVLSETLVESTLNTPFAKRSVVMSRARADFLCGKGARAVPVGPYIQYTDSFFGEAEIGAIKRKLGKTLLFFPSHSTLDICIKDSYGDVNKLLDYLKKNHHFDTVLVCGYYLDIEKGLFDNIEKKEGFQFISCGHRHGPSFLALLKSFILLSDVVASNSIGTQTGYAIFYGKPFWALKDKNIQLYYKGDSARVSEELKSNEQPLLTGDGMSFIEFEDLFKNQDDSVAAETVAYVRRLWGFDEIVTKEELHRAVL